ncbi:hypothetical protein QWY82_09965 [Simiduia curdlanivorans]|uniref:Uncharacterized protein n=1 Tax=Simiduia curdlanivorans TaxID=1492769 RepID=A0ABV8V163_9GAMM|nr:hypothetical protein [Simiduia curdlanivorans]MDN3639134.1 hypothetical protein [Simiduia curdlanivorans]
MIENKRLQLWLFIGGAALLVSISITATVLIAKHFRADFNSANSTKRALGIVENRPKFDLYAGYGLCEQATREKMEGKIINLNMDRRTALYDDYERTNTLIFTADVVPRDQRFLSEQHSTKKMHVQCVTSADTNTLTTLVIAPADE